MRKWAPKVFNVSTGNSVSTVLKLWFLCQTKPIWSTLYAYFSHQSFPIRSHYKLISSSVHIYTGVVSQSWWPCHPTWAVWAVTKWPLFGIQTVMHHNKLPCYRYCKGDDKENHPPNPPTAPSPQVRCQLEDGTSWTNGLMTWSRDALAADTVGPEWSTSAAGPDQTLTTTHLQVKLKNILEWGWHSRTGLLEDLTSQFSNRSLRIRS